MTFKYPKLARDAFANITDWTKWNYLTTGPEALINRTSDANSKLLSDPTVLVYVKIKDGYSFETMDETQQFLKSLVTDIHGSALYPYMPKEYIKPQIYWQSGQELFYEYSSLESWTFVQIKHFYYDNPIIEKISWKVFNNYDRESIVKVLNNLQSITTTQTLTLGSTLLAKLTDEDKKIATDKGWTLA